jgi:hypothetical protein
MLVETNFDATYFVEFAKTNYNIPISCIITYILFISMGPMIMKLYDKHSTIHVTIPLAVWNGFLCFFSLIGTYKTVPPLLSLIHTTSFNQVVCTNPDYTWGKGSTGLWVTLFCFSKIPELMDTVFIVLRRKPILFLHWYHHFSVLYFAWDSYASKSSFGLYFVAMNYTVHTIMYGYYCLQTLKKLPKHFPSYIITYLQIAQMFIGLYICNTAWYFKLNNIPCHNQLSSLMISTIIYGSYFVLFCKFALDKQTRGCSQKLE